MTLKMSEKAIIGTDRLTDRPINHHTDQSTSWVAPTTRNNNLDFKKISSISKHVSWFMEYNKSKSLIQ